MTPERKHQAKTETSKKKRAALVKPRTTPKPKRPRAHLAYLLAQSINPESK